MQRRPESDFRFLKIVFGIVSKDKDKGQGKGKGEELIFIHARGRVESSHRNDLTPIDAISLV